MEINIGINRILVYVIMIIKFKIMIFTILKKYKFLKMPSLRNVLQFVKDYEIIQ